MQNLFRFADVAYAQAGNAAGQPSFFEMLIMPAVFLAIMYFLIIRPQQRKARDHQNLLQNLKVGDEVITSGGLIGRVKSVAQDFVTIDISNNTPVKVTKNHIQALTQVAAKAKA